MSGGHSSDDRGLVSTFLATRSEAAFSRLYLRFAPRMLRLADELVRGSDANAEDVVQEAWVRAVRVLPAFEWRSSLATWLAGVVVNVAREQRRLAGRGRDQPADDDREVEWDDPLTRIELAQALDRLAPGFRSVVTLHDVAGFTHDEIASILNIDPGTSKSQLARGRARIRSYLRPDRKDSNDGE